MISVIYASIAAFLITWLSLDVIKKRRKHLVSVGDGGNKELQIAIATQSNAIEYLPIAFLLLFALEFNKANIWLIHMLGITLLAGRVIHVIGMRSESMKARVFGMHITIYILISLAIINFVFLPYEKILQL